MKSTERYNILRDQQEQRARLKSEMLQKMNTPVKWNVYFDGKHSTYTVKPDYQRNYELVSRLYGSDHSSSISRDIWRYSDIERFSARKTHYPKDFNSWKSLVNYCLNHKQLGLHLQDSCNYFKDIKNNIDSLTTDPFEKSQLAFNAIKAVNWNGINSIFSSPSSLKDVWQQKSGNSADVNLLLVKLLNTIGIDAYPLLIRTRDRGLIDLSQPSLNQLNYLVAHVIINNKSYIVDATDRNLAFGILPSRCINQAGLMIKERITSFISLTPEFKAIEYSNMNLMLNEDLSLSGTIVNTMKSYAAYNFRCLLEQSESDSSVISMLEYENPGLKIRDYKIENRDNINDAISEKISVNISGGAKKINDSIFINPFLIKQQKNHPFTAKGRSCPIDFVCGQNNLVVSTIEIPEGYRVSKLPDNLFRRFDDNSIMLKIQYQLVGCKIMTTYNLSINKPIFQPEEYDGLKSVFDCLIEKQAESIVLIPNKVRN